MATDKTVSAKEALKIAEEAAAKGDREKAIKYYNAVLQKYPDNEKAIAGYQKLHPNTLFRSDIDDLEKLFSEGKHKEVEVRAGMYLERYPDVAELWNLLGSVTLINGNAEKALGHFKKAATIEPYNADIQFNLGNAFRATGDIKRAKISYDQSMKFNEKHVGAMNAQGTIYMQEKQFKNAVGIFMKAAKLAPKSVGTLANTAIALKAIGDYNQAINYYRRVIDFDGTPLRIFIDLADCELLNGNPDEARRIFEIITNEGPENYMAHFQYGLFLKKIGDEAGADEQFEKAIKLNPDLKVPGKVN